LNNKIELQHEFLLLERSLPDFAAGGEYPDWGTKSGGGGWLI
jgi:hypothetical protein